MPKDPPKKLVHKRLGQGARKRAKVRAEQTKGKKLNSKQAMKSKSTKPQSTAIVKHRPSPLARITKRGVLGRADSSIQKILKEFDGGNKMKTSSGVRKFLIRVGAVPKSSSVSAPLASTISTAFKNLPADKIKVVFAQTVDGLKRATTGLKGDEVLEATGRFFGLGPKIKTVLSKVGKRLITPNMKAGGIAAVAYGLHDFSAKKARAKELALAESQIPTAEDLTRRTLTEDMRRRGFIAEMQKGGGDISVADIQKVLGESSSGGYESVTLPPSSGYPTG